MRLYLKPWKGNNALMTFLLLMDTALAITYGVAQTAYVIDGIY